MVTITGGGKLEAYLKKISAAADVKGQAQIGFMENATYPDGTSVALVAFVNEYGRQTVTKDAKTGKTLSTKQVQPPRPFFRNAISERAEAWGKNLGTALKRFNYNAPMALALAGLGAKEDIQDSIRRLVSPPLAASTIAAKSRGTVVRVRGAMGPEKPLVDSGHMLASVAVRVKTGVK